MAGISAPCHGLSWQLGGGVDHRLKRRYLFPRRIDTASYWDVFDGLRSRAKNL
jgi:hypothetical protein